MYICTATKGACWKVKLVLQKASKHSFKGSKEASQPELELKASKYSFSVSGNPSASWFFSSLRCPSDFPSRLYLLFRHVPPSNSNFLSQPQVALAGIQTAPSWGRVLCSMRRDMCTAGCICTLPGVWQRQRGIASQSKFPEQRSPSP